MGAEPREPRYPEGAADHSAPLVREDFPGLGGAFGLILVVLASALGIGIVLALVTFPFESSEDLVVYFSFQGGMAAAILWGWRRTGLPFREVFSIRPVPPRLYLAVAISAPAFLVLEEKLVALQFRFAPPSESLLELLNADYFTYWWEGLIVGVVLAPVFEELLFRGLMLRGLARRHGLTTALLVTSALFAVLHVVPYLLLPLFLLALLLGWWTVRTRSILPAVAWHALNNLLALSEETGLLPRRLEDLHVSADWTGPRGWEVAIGAVALLGATIWAKKVLAEPLAPQPPVAEASIDVGPDPTGLPPRERNDS